MYAMFKYTYIGPQCNHKCSFRNWNFEIWCTAEAGTKNVKMINVAIKWSI